MGRGSNTQAKRRREAERDRKNQEKQERAKDRREGAGGVEIGSVADIQSAAFNERVEGVLPDGTVLNGRENDGSSSGPPCRLFVGGLSWETSADDLRKAFESVGKVLDVVLMFDRDTGDSRGFGFVTMADPRTGNKAMRELSGFELDGRTIRIDLATER